MKGLASLFFRRHVQDDLSTRMFQVPYSTLCRSYLHQESPVGTKGE